MSGSSGCDSNESWRGAPGDDRQLGNPGPPETDSNQRRNSTLMTNTCSQTTAFPTLATDCRPPELRSNPMGDRKEGVCRTEEPRHGDQLLDSRDWHPVLMSVCPIQMRVSTPLIPRDEDRSSGSLFDSNTPGTVVNSRVPGFSGNPRSRMPHPRSHWLNIAITGAPWDDLMSSVASFLPPPFG